MKNINLYLKKTYIWTAHCCYGVPCHIVLICFMFWFNEIKEKLKSNNENNRCPELGRFSGYIYRVWISRRVSFFSLSAYGKKFRQCTKKQLVYVYF